jgi:hypothetical protein
MLEAAQFFATLFCTVCAGAAIYISLVEHPARMGCDTKNCRNGLVAKLQARDDDAGAVGCVKLHVRGYGLVIWRRGHVAGGCRVNRLGCPIYVYRNPAYQPSASHAGARPGVDRNSRVVGKVGKAARCAERT